MALTTIPTTLEEQKWDEQLFEEWTRDSLYKPYMGEAENDLIQVREDLTTEAGKSITFPLAVRLTGDGVDGDETLRENEEALNLYSDSVEVDQKRNAVLVGKMTQQKTSIDMRATARSRLKIWSMDKQRDLIIARKYSPHLDGVTAYADATEAAKDAWLAANSDRVLFGSVVGNNATNDHSAALLTIDGTSDDLGPEIISLAKRRAKLADPHIRPIMTKGGREWYVMFAGSLAFRDLKTNLGTIHQNAGVRGEDNPLFQDGDLVYDGVIIREVPEIPVLTGVGAGGIDVTAVFLCGAQALLWAWAQRSKTVVDATIDYGNQTGVAIGEIRGCKKAVFNSKQHGMVTVYVSAVADL